MRLLKAEEARIAESAQRPPQQPADSRDDFDNSVVSTTGDDDGAGMDCATLAEGQGEHSPERAAVSQ
jgi:hypothetical protein